MGLCLFPAVPHGSGSLLLPSLPPSMLMTHRYGQQLVPVEDDALLAYKPEPCLELLGFTARENVPRW